MSHSFPEVTAAWKADKRQWVKPSTYAIYTRLANVYILPFYGQEPPDAAAIQALANDMLERGLSIKTVRDTMLVLKMILHYGAETGAWPPIACKIHYPPQGVRTLSILSRPQQRLLMDYLNQHFSFQNLGILICLHSGLRIGEICALQWRDIDIAAGEIHVTKTVQRICITDAGRHEYYLSVDRPKTPTSIRDIPITRELKSILKPLKRILLAEDYVVSNARKPLEPRYLRDHFHRLLDSLHLPRLRFHALRHSFATRCIESKCDYKTVSVLLGHTSISTTMDLYVHPGADEKKRAVEQMLRRLSS